MLFLLLLSTAPFSSVDGSVQSFQQYLDYQTYCDELESVGFLNVRVGVNSVQVGLNLLLPEHKSYRDALTTGTGTKKTLPTGSGTKKTLSRGAPCTANEAFGFYKSKKAPQSRT